jgi:lipid A ethanolaminephosphotransferase
MSPVQLIIATAVFIVATGNVAFFTLLVNAYPLVGENIGFLASVAILQTALLILFLMPLAYRGIVKPGLALILLVTAVCAYFADQYGVVIDSVMIHSTFATNTREALDLVNIGFAARLVLLGLLPACLVLLAPLRDAPLTTRLWQNLGVCGACLIAVVVVLFAFSAHYTSFFREHKVIRFYTNPIGPVYALGYVLAVDRESTPQTIESVAGDAHIVRAPGQRPKLAILVVGEAVRFHNLGLNGYHRDTTPELAALDVINFRDFKSCGTATAVSVPCMFSALGQNDFSIDAAARQENLLDILQRAGVSVLWRDNNSDSKGVANRVPYESYMSPSVNTVCGVECRDEGMLPGLQAWVDARPGTDILIVLHQMGNHGPAYYKRYPAAFEVYTPACESNELAACTDAEIVNAYDNAIRYTDYFLSRVIALLRQNAADRATAMLYVSDHGESLGEFGLYLHGLPRSLAPDEQVHVPAILWLGNDTGIDRTAMQAQAGKPWSHDNLFPTMLDLFNVRTDALIRAQSILQVE